jgi:hypothetical protein
MHYLVYIRYLCLEGSTSPWLIEPLSLVFVIETVNFNQCQILQNEALYSHARMDVLAIISGNATNITEKPEKIL